MQCPVDQTTLAMSERSGIEIDYCPTCRGVWLDRGELDKLIESSESSAPAQQAPPQSQRSYDEPKRHYDDRSSYDGGYHKKKKKESFLGEIFDF